MTADDPERHWGKRGPRDVDFETEGHELALKSLRFNFRIVTGLEESCSRIVVEGANRQQVPRPRWRERPRRRCRLRREKTPPNSTLFNAERRFHPCVLGLLRRNDTFSVTVYFCTVRARTPTSRVRIHRRPQRLDPSRKSCSPWQRPDRLHPQAVRSA